MGVSGRASFAMEPMAGDLLMPERGRRPRAVRPRDVEDACFETVGTPRDLFSGSSSKSKGGVFKSRIAEPPAEGPVPRDYSWPEESRPMSASPRERLGIFNESVPAARFPVPMAAPALALGLSVAVAAVIWTRNDDRLENRPLAAVEQATTPARTMSAPLAASVVKVMPDPVVTSSVPQTKAAGNEPGFSAPVARPARIERAGSILMIRPAGD